MGTVVIRSRNPKGLLNLSEDTRRRAREYLQAQGIRLDKIPRLFWPEDAISAYQETIYSPWQFTTKGDIRRAKIARMEEHLRRKRERKGPERRWLYVWVFHCPGISGFFRGWYTYLVGGRGSDYNLYYSDDIGRQLMGLFPLCESSLFDQDQQPTWFGLNMPDEWMMRFVKLYRRGCWAGKPQGKAAIRAEMEGNRVTHIIDKVKWLND